MSRDPSVLDDNPEGMFQRADALRVLALALASNGIPDGDAIAPSVLRDIEEGGYTLRLTTHAERFARNRKWASDSPEKTT